MSEQGLQELSVDLAATTSGSRTFAGQFKIEWTPSETKAELLIRITAAGSLITQGNFDPDNATQYLEGDNGTYAFRGTLIAGFNSPPTSGTLFGQDLTFKGPNGAPRFSGTIGVW
jgi:hypothetical protein